MTKANLQLLEAAADSSFEGRLVEWPVLRAIFRSAGAPCSPGLRGALVRQIAGELLVELGVRPRPEGPLVAVSLGVFLRTWPRVPIRP